jgi:hypothetical protein
LFAERRASSTRLDVSGDVDSWMAAKRAEAARLASSRSGIEVMWLDTSHFMVTDRPGQVAALVLEFATRS